MTGIGGLAENVAAFVPFQTKLVQDAGPSGDEGARSALPWSGGAAPGLHRGPQQPGASRNRNSCAGNEKAFDAITGKLSVFLSYKRAQHGRSRSCSGESLEGFGGSKIDVFWTR